MNRKNLLQRTYPLINFSVNRYSVKMLFVDKLHLTLNKNMLSIKLSSRININFNIYIFFKTVQVEFEPIYRVEFVPLDSNYTPNYTPVFLSSRMFGAYLFDLYEISKKYMIFYLLFSWVYLSWHSIFEFKFEEKEKKIVLI